MMQNQKPIGYKFDYPQDQAQVVITLKSGVQVKTTPESLEEARVSASGFQIMIEDYERGESSAMIKSTADLFVNLAEIAAIEVVTL